MDPKTETAARKVLGIPAFPSRGTGPVSAAIVAKVQADRAKLGDVKARDAWAHCCTVAYTASVDTDSAAVKAVCRFTAAQTAAVPVTTTLADASKDPAARAKCSAAELTALDAAVATKPTGVAVAEEIAK